MRRRIVDMLGKRTPRLPCEAWEDRGLTPILTAMSNGDDTRGPTTRRLPLHTARSAQPTYVSHLLAIDGSGREASYPRGMGAASRARSALDRTGSRITGHADYRPRLVGPDRA